MVLADGSFVTASAEEHADLFWAVRGGGGNFGVVTSFLFQLHPISTVYGGPMLWPIEQAADVMKFWRDFILNAPEEINGWFGVYHGTARATFPGAVSPAEDVRHRVVLHRPAGAGRRALPAHSRERSAGGGFRRADPVAGAAESVRRALPAGLAVVLEGRLLHRPE